MQLYIVEVNAIFQFPFFDLLFCVKVLTLNLSVTVKLVVISAIAL